MATGKVTDRHNIFKQKALETGIEFNVQIGPDVPEVLVGDAPRLKQVLINLVSNALKFTTEGEVDVEVKLLKADGSSVQLLFEVADTGIGIPPDKQQAIFESFTQASSETTRKFGGTGLGLTISKRIVESQGGKLAVRSTPGNGSLFFFELTFTQPTAETQLLPSAASNPAHVLQARPLKVLLAEDNHLNQRLATIVLTNLGHTPILAKNGLEALAMVQSELPDIVLMDVQMPEMDGLEATRAIRALADPVLRNIPIIALTAHALRREIERCLDAGMNAFLAKPFQAEALAAKIAEFANTARNPLPLMAQKAESQALDLGQLNEMVGNDEGFRRELIAIFLTEVPKAIQQMQQAMQYGDSAALAKVAHSIKPSLLLFKVPNATALLSEIESALDTQKHLETIVPHVEDLIRAAEGTVEALNRTEIVAG